MDEGSEVGLNHIILPFDLIVGLGVEGGWEFSLDL